MPTVDSPASEQDVRIYQERGFIRYKNFFSKAEMDRLRAAIDEAIASNRDRILGAEGGGRSSEEYEKVFNQMVNLWVDSPVAKEFAFSERLAETGRRLSQAKHVRIYHDHAMVKPGGQGSKQTNWHQDAPYWPMDPVGSLSAWIAVDDVTVENGCLHFVPGSHKYGRLEAISLTDEGDSIVAKMKERGFEVAEPEAMEMGAGGQRESATWPRGGHHVTPGRPEIAAKNSVPSPSVDTSIVPPCSAMRRSQIASPKPVPLPAPFVVVNGSKRLGINSGGIPGPSSPTTNVRVSPAACASTHADRAPASAALIKRFSTTCVTWGSAASTGPVSGAMRTCTSSTRARG